MIDPAQITPFRGFAPDLDPATPGIFLDTQNLAPTAKGFEPFETPVPAYPALDNPVRGAYLARYLDGSTRIIAGTSNKLYVGKDGSWTQKGSGYTVGANSRWRFTMFGNTVIAVNGTDAPQAATGADAAFGNLTGSPPVAKLTESVNNFLFMANEAAATDRWYCAGIGTATVWAADIAAQSNNDRINERPGPLTALRALGPDLVMYKLMSCYLGRYVGPPLVWDFQMLSPDTGTWGNESVVTFYGDSQFFVGWADFWVTNGGRPQKIESNLREWFFEESLDQNYAERIICRWDRTRDVIIINYPSREASPQGTLDKELVWHHKTNRWTRGDRTIEFALLPELPFVPGLSYDAFGTLFATWDDPGSTLYESLAFQSVARPVQAIFKTDHILYSMTGTPGPSHFITGDWGDDTLFSHLIRVKPRFGRYPTDDAQITNYYRYNLGEPGITDKTQPLAYQGWYNIRRAARWHRFLYEFDGDYEIVGMQPILQPRGAR